MRKALLNLGDHRQQWIIHLAERPGYIDTVHSSIYICPYCEDIWARIRVIGLWDAWTLGMPCENCPPYRKEWVPGSLLRNLAYYETDTEIDLQLLRALPAELLEREFNLHLKALEREPYYGTAVRDERREDNSRRNPLADDPEFAKYFQPSAERPRSIQPIPAAEPSPDIFATISALVAAGRGELPSGSERDDHGTDGHGQDPHHRDPG